MAPVTSRRRRLTLQALVLVAPLLAALGAAPGRGEPIEVGSTAVVLNLEDRSQTTVGRLRYLGGLKLSSRDPRFGGLSGLTFTADGRRLVAVSDHGFWFTAELVSDPDGVPEAIVGADLSPLLGPDGTPLQGRRRDAEAVERAPSGAYIVSFERAHRLLRYGAAGGSAGARPTLLATPPALGGAPANGGVEAIAVLGPGRLLVVTEDLRVGADAVAGWLIDGARAWPLSYLTRHRFKPTDFALLPSGDVLALERRYGPIAGPGARLVRIGRAAIVPGARLAGTELARLVPPLTVDNMEGLAVRRAPDGATLVYLLSDDNYNPLQATLLMVFRLAE